MLVSILAMASAAVIGGFVGRLLPGRTKGNEGGAQRSAKGDSNPDSLLLANHHDLRQPLQALGLFITALRHKGLPEDVDRVAGRIEQSYSAFISEFDALVDLERLKTGRLALTPTEIAQEDFWPQLDTACAALTDAKGQMVRCHRGRQGFVGDPTLLTKALTILVSLSLDASAPGGMVLVGVRRRRGQIRFEVWHGAPGMKAERLDAILSADHSSPLLKVRLLHFLVLVMGGHLTGAVFPGGGKIVLCIPA